MMNNLKYSVLFLFMISLNMHAQESNPAKDVSIYLDSNGAMKQYDYAYGQLLEMLVKQYPKSDQNKQGWEYLEGNKENAIAEMKEMLIPVYTKNFKNKDIQQMIVFYQSDTGKQLTNDRSKMTEDQKQELNTFYTSELGARIIKKQAVLTEEIGVISQNWSRDLYETAISLLRE